MRIEFNLCCISEFNFSAMLFCVCVCFFFFGFSSCSFVKHWIIIIKFIPDWKYRYSWFEDVNVNREDTNKFFFLHLFIFGFYFQMKQLILTFYVKFCSCSFLLFAGFVFVENVCNSWPYSHVTDAVTDEILDSKQQKPFYPHTNSRFVSIKQHMYPIANSNRNNRTHWFKLMRIGLK